MTFLWLLVLLLLFTRLLLLLLLMMMLSIAQTIGDAIIERPTCVILTIGT